MVIRLAPLLVAALAGCANVAPSAWRQDRTASMHLIHGRFTQSNYGFSVAIPPNNPGYVTNGGDGDHGILVILGERREIDVYPEYIFADLDMAPCDGSPFPPGASRTGPAQLAVLGTVPACTVRATQGQGVWQAIQATGDDRGTGILYTVLLRSDRAHLDEDLGALRLIAQSFRRAPIVP